MSQLIEKFRKAIQASERPMGFLSSRLNQPAPKLILIAGIDAGKPCDGSALGHADAVFLRADQAENPAEAIRKMASSLGNLPWGTRLEEAISHARTGKAKAGAEPDFVVFSATSEVRSLPQDENTGKILQIEDSMDDGLIRAVNSLPVDAVLVASMSDSAALVWHQLMIFQHLANLVTKPLIIPASPDISEREIKIIWESGVDGILVDTDDSSVAKLQELRRMITELPPRSARRNRPEARVPRIPVEEAKVSPPDEEEEEEP